MSAEQVHNEILSSCARLWRGITVPETLGHAQTLEIINRRAISTTMPTKQREEALDLIDPNVLLHTQEILRLRLHLRLQLLLPLHLPLLLLACWGRADRASALRPA